MRKSYDFSNGVRGKHRGMTFEIVGATPEKITKACRPDSVSRELIVKIEDDLRDKFPDEAAVNSALRSLLKMTNK
jgi:hypothetical protein